MKQLNTLLACLVFSLASLNLSGQSLANLGEVILTFTPDGDGATVTATANDPDGSGPMGFQLSGPINLMESTDYTLAITLRENGSNADLTNLVVNDGANYLFFFAFSDALFASPAGDGNADNRQDPVNYLDQDGNMLPLGLSTRWTTQCVEESEAGSLRIILKHQPGSKSATSSATDGDTEFDLSWNVTVENDPDAPPCENEEEVIDKVTLIFTPVAGGEALSFVASDPDGPGPLSLQVEDIVLDESTEYDLSIMVENTIEGEDITEEILEEDQDHLFLFAFSDELFASPAGDGNIDNRQDPVNYLDQDENMLPVGLRTNWTTQCVEASAAGSLRIILKHQPGIKSATSSVEDGGTDLDLTWNVTVENDPDAPPCENEEEVIDKVTLIFTPVAGGEALSFVASDPDGPGPLSLQVEDIVLDESTEYDLSIMVENTIEGEDITEEILEEDQDHLFLFAFSDELFASPAGDGNIDNRQDPVNYLDQDENMLPVGLRTNWTTQCVEASAAGSLRIILKHQPGIKSATSSVEDGGTDLDLTWNVTVENDPDAPPCENEEEVIDKVTLTFTPVAGGEALSFVASDPDGPGPLSLQVEDITLTENTEYEMRITVENTIEGEDITEEILEEDQDHLFLFAFSDALFANPEGDGNIDNRADPVNYLDQDENMLPVGLLTGWTTAAGAQTGTLRVVLKHQPGIKSATSSIEDGGTDLDVSWNISTVVTSTREMIRTTGMRIQPNPVAGQVLRFEMTEGALYQPAEVLIYDMFGRLVLRDRRQAVESVNTLLLPNLAEGPYVLQIRTQEGSWVQRFIKR